MNTHSQRLKWLESHGWKVFDLTRPQQITGIGLSARFEETAAPHRGLWLAISTGVALLDGPRDEGMTWQQLVDWIDGKEPEVKKPLAGQRSLFGDE